MAFGLSNMFTIKVAKYFIEIALVVLSALPILAPKKFKYLEKRFAKICCALSVGVLSLSIADDITSSIAEQRIQSQIQALEDQKAPWTFTSDQKSTFAQILKDAPKCKIELSTAESDSPRSIEFSRILRPILVDLGYDVQQQSGMFFNNSETPVSGILIEFGDEKDKEAALHLVGAFLKSNIPCKWYFRKPNESALVPWLNGIVTISIGDKPNKPVDPSG